MENKIDDGSLSFLNIKIDGELKTYDCPVIKQSYLINKTLYKYIVWLWYAVGHKTKTG